MAHWTSAGNNFYWRKIIVLVGALFVVMLMGRSYEIVLGVWNFGSNFVSLRYVLGAVINDFQFSLLSMPVVLLLAWGLGRFQKQPRVDKIIAHFIAVLGVLHILLISYFGSTQMPLGTEFWAYSLNEMMNTVIAAEQLTVLGMVVVIIFYVLCYFIAFKLQAANIFEDVQLNVLFGTVAGIAVVFVGSLIFIYSNSTTAVQHEKQANKLSYFVSQSITSAGWNKGTTLDIGSDEYPFLRSAQYDEDVLGPFFEEFERPPNVVFLLVESLGGEFIGQSGQWTGFAPYLDSLSQQGLYWENGLSLSGRTFGMVPSLLGSLPFGRHGFMDLGPDYPNHQSLISMLDERGYYTAFYSGYDTYFDGLDFFLEYQGTDYKLNKQKLEKLLPQAHAQSNYWGVDDKTMLEFASGLLDTADTFPRLEIYHTLQSHSPFTVPNPEKYKQQFKNRLKTLQYPAKKKQAYQQYQAEFMTLLYADQAVKDFMESYKKNPQFENTIFVITGDHWLIPVPQTTAISRYHVPIIIYSPKLKEPVHFKSVNTHAEITPSLVALLDQKTSLDMPEQVHWISGLMDTTRGFQSVQSVPFMRNKNRISDYLDGEYYLFGDELYKVMENLLLVPQDSLQKQKQVHQKLDTFKSMNNFAVQNNRLYPGQDAKYFERYAFLSEYDTLFARLDSLSLTVDEQFRYARKRAFDGDYEVARAIAKRILLQAPDYHDVRILIGRTNAWEGMYEQAEQYFNTVLEEDPAYEDAYNAYVNNEYWQGDYNSALQMINEGLEHHPQNKLLLERRVQVLAALDRDEEAREAYQKFIKLGADPDKLRALKKYVGD